MSPIVDYEDGELRMMIAALAMNGLLSGQTNYNAGEIQERGETYAENIAKDAVIYADALIQALQKKDKQ